MKYQITESMKYRNDIKKIRATNIFVYIANPFAIKSLINY